MGYERKWNDDKPDEPLHPLVIIGVIAALIAGFLFVIGFFH